MLQEIYDIKDPFNKVWRLLNSEFAKNHVPLGKVFANPVTIVIVTFFIAYL